MCSTSRCLRLRLAWSCSAPCSGWVSSTARLTALLLSVLPMLASWQALSALGWTASWPGRVASGVLALFASLVVAAFYHLGYAEYRNPSVIGPLIGNGVMSLATLLTMNPIAAVGAHIAIHIAAVLHGIDTAVQLPPHYGF